MTKEVYPSVLTDAIDVVKTFSGYLGWLKKQAMEMQDGKFVNQIYKSIIQLELLQMYTQSHIDELKESEEAK